MAGGSKAKATRPDKSTTLESRNLLHRVQEAGDRLVAECAADPRAAKALLKRIGAPPLKRLP